MPPDEGRRWPYPLFKYDVVTAFADGEIHLMRENSYFRHVYEEEENDSEQ